MWYLFASEVAKGTFPSYVNWLSMQNCKSHFLGFASSGSQWHSKVPCNGRKSRSMVLPPSMNLITLGSTSSSLNDWTVTRVSIVRGYVGVYPFSSHCRERGISLRRVATLWMSVTLLWWPKSFLWSCSDQMLYSPLGSSSHHGSAHCLPLLSPNQLLGDYKQKYQ